MISIWEFRARIDALSSYLNFSNDNWVKYEQIKDSEIQNKMDVLRQKFVYYQDLNEHDFWEKFGERQTLQYDIWNASDDGIELDYEFHLEPEEYDLFLACEIKSEFLEGKPFVYASFVMMTYSFIERHVAEICLNVFTKDGILFDDVRLKGKGIQRAYAFLEKIMGYKLDELAWEELMMIRRLRNNLVHQGFDVGIHQGGDIEKLYANGIPKFEQDLVEYLTKWNIFRFPSIILNAEYCHHLIGFTKEFFEKLINDLRVNDRNLFL